VQESTVLKLKSKVLIAAILAAVAVAQDQPATKKKAQSEFQ